MDSIERPYADIDLTVIDDKPEPAGDSIPLRIPSGRTEAANAKRFVNRFGQNVRWVDPWQKWLFWDGRRWQIDERRQLDTFAKQLTESLWQQAATEARQSEDDVIKFLWRFATASNQTRGVSNLLALAKSDVPIRPQELDQHSWLLNCQNGIVDLREGTLTPHDRERFLTQLAGTTFQPDATCPRWEQFLQTILAGDEQLIGYLQRLMGLSLTGSTAEHILPILHGAGANGKSVLIDTWLALLGSYGMKANAELLLASRDRHPTEVADLFRVRLVACLEADEGRRLAEGLVKELTGGDILRARRMREDFWQFSPTHKLVLASNHRPVVRGNDHGLWRRLRLVPFNVVIPDHEQDKQLAEKLRAELPGILQWAVRGCLEWQREGLQEPQSVKAATGDYRAEQDVLGLFLADCCVFDPELEVQATSLFTRFRSWCDANNERATNQTRFGRQLTERGFSTKRTKNGVVRIGIGLLDEGAGEQL